jgi:hypothetical protein
MTSQVKLTRMGMRTGIGPWCSAPACRLKKAHLLRLTLDLENGAHDIVRAEPR